ncbi:Uncharacterised protein [Bordetella pertussis]|nr:Uncharacterised protein [Bordetella pertussis]
MLGMLVAAEQQGAIGGAGDQHQPGLGLGEAGQVEEIAVVPVRILGVAIAQGLRRGGQDGDAAARGAHVIHQAPAARGKRGDVVGRQAHCVARSDTGLFTLPRPRAGQADCLLQSAHCHWGVAISIPGSVSEQRPAPESQRQHTWWFRTPWR